MGDRRSVVGELFEVLNSKRFDALGDLLADDAVFDVAYFPEGAAMRNPTEGRSAVRDVFATVVPSMFENMRLEIAETYPGEDPEVLVVEYTSRATAKPTGRPYANRYVGIFRVRDGRVALWREYHNPERMAEAFGSTAG